jgi:hypothetical protein
MRKSCLNVCEERDIITCGSDSLVANWKKKSSFCLFVVFDRFVFVFVLSGGRTRLRVERQGFHRVHQHSSRRITQLFQNGCLCIALVLLDSNVFAISALHNSFRRIALCRVVFAISAFCCVVSVESDDGQLFFFFFRKSLDR